MNSLRNFENNASEEKDRHMVYYSFLSQKSRIELDVPCEVDALKKIFFGELPHFELAKISVFFQGRLLDGFDVLPTTSSNNLLNIVDKRGNNLLKYHFHFIFQSLFLLLSIYQLHHINNQSRILMFIIYYLHSLYSRIFYSFM
jgi:hypothetical protein